MTKRMMSIIIMALFCMTNIPIGMALSSGVQQDWPISSGSLMRDGATEDLNYSAVVDSGGLDGRFLFNKGQISDPDVIFYSQDAYFTAHGVIYRVMDKRQGMDVGTSNPSTMSRMQTYSVEFEGSPGIRPIGRGELGVRTNFFVGKDPAGWFTDVPSYNEIVYEGLYDGIDLEYRWSPEGLKYQFIVSPGANPNDIGMRYQGVDLATVDTDLLIRTSVGTVADGDLLVYQQPPNGNSLLTVDTVRVVENNLVRYRVGDYDHARDLVIDPLVFSTFIGGNDWDEGISMAHDSSGNILLAGATYSPNFPTTPGAYCSTFSGDRDVYILKLSSDGKNLLYSTFVGGTGDDSANGIALDSANNAYVTGEADSTDFPTTAGALNATFRGGSGDAFILKLNPSGNALIYSSFLGGKDLEAGNDVAIDTAGNAYVTGYTYSANFPVTPGAYCMTYSGTYLGFVSKVNPTGNGLIYSTLIGGGKGDRLNAIVVDDSFNVYLTGTTASKNFPITHGSYSTVYNGGNGDAFVVKLNASGDGLIFSTFLGGEDGESGRDLVLNEWGETYIIGTTFSDYFPTTSQTFKYDNGAQDIFISRLSSTGKTLKYSALIGGYWNDIGYSISIVNSNEVIFTGYSESPDFPTTDGAYCQTVKGTSDVIISKLNITNDDMTYSTFLGGKSIERGCSISILPSGEVDVVGTTYSKDFPTTQNAYDTTYNGGSNDVFVLRFRFSKVIPGAPLNLAGTPGDSLVRLSWDPPIDQGDSLANSYQIYRWNYIEPDKKVGVAFKTEYSDKYSYYLPYGMICHYAVSAINEAGEGNKSGTFDIILGAHPNPPYNLYTTSWRNQVNLTWHPPSHDNGYPITNYSIYRSENYDDFLKLVTLGNVTKYIDGNVTNGIQYLYEVSAHNLIGESSKSSYSSAVPGGPPYPPRNFTAIGMLDHIELAWDPPIDIGGQKIVRYDIYRGEQIEKLSLLNHTIAMFYTDTLVKLGHTYYYRVRAITYDWTGDLSEIVKASPWISLKPPVLYVDESPGELDLTWNVPTPGMLPLLYYRIHKGTSPSDMSTIIDTMELSYNDTDVTVGVTYYYAISAVDMVDEGNMSAIVYAKPYGYPDTPGALTARSISGHIRLTWMAPANDGGRPITTYTLFKGMTPETSIVLTNLSGNIYEDFDVAIGTTYYYSIASFNGYLQSNISNTISIIPTNRPGKIDNITLEVGDGVVTLRWNPPKDTGGLTIKSYNIQRWASGGGPFQTFTVPEEVYTDQEVLNGRTYHYAISPINDVGAGDPFESAWVTPGRTPGPPISFALEGSTDKVTLTWSAPVENGGTDVISYVVYRGESSNVLIPIAKVNGTWYIDHDVKKGFNYYYKIAAINGRGEGGSTQAQVVSLKVEKKQATNNYLIPVLAIIIAVVVIIVAFLLYRWQKKGTAIEGGFEEIMEMEKPKKKQRRRNRS